MSLSTQDTIVYNQLLNAISQLPVGCPVLIRQDYCEILGFKISAGQAKRFGIELSQNTPSWLQFVKLASNNLNSYKRI